MDFLVELGMFVAKSLTIVISIAAIALILIGLGMKQKHRNGELELTDLSELHEEMGETLTASLLSKEELKKHKKELKKQHKQEKKKAKKEPETSKPRLFVLDFKGSIDAKEVQEMREEVSAVIIAANEEDQVLIRLESGGGMVHAYGLASSQIERLRAANIHITISVDKVAASGGYMMACLGNDLIAAPFAIIGSIGVIAQIPNFNKILKKNDVEFEQLTAGEYKRTLTMFGENTDAAREKFKQELEETHVLFKEFVSERRPQLDIVKVATGEHWYGSQALDLQLIDKIQTSDDFVMQAHDKFKVVLLKYHGKKKLSERIAQAASMTIESLALKVLAARSWDWTK
ncbi:protease SohB [Alginatibacterium sediminis]|uniref:Protease SohB n=1 Tax=Alginatibacterium sediminis TaxID=2164068 RepID=A0A420EHR6_9ALTE|nr:protease SohB [Alginatibacterium sediminis]RKF20262.1 protease SohB [Alginatibacterium sediminis]